jgi:hypothetical protein
MARWHRNGGDLLNRPSPLVGRARLPRSARAGLLLAASFVMATITSACFEPPDGAVTFACDLFYAPECPDGYACQSDGCCHEIGSDFATNEGACRLGGEEGVGTTTGGEDSGDTTTGGTTGD